MYNIQDKQKYNARYKDILCNIQDAVYKIQDMQKYNARYKDTQC